ncbi:PCYCGC motif-containing (lipo)protein [Bacillus sp. FJAT-28004]|uniref:PCYCGC motif-containing (lipo)protein n=1 Tax=Bacillus sp. FJAT-28004 TaxID=1679165 RepID=UPI000B1D015D|nr:PCYCGC motif-containing (lipo)protein [Bacillus sp. FJAT-28004]
MKRLAKTTIYSVLLSSMLLSACSSQTNSTGSATNAHEANSGNHGDHQTASGDLQETTASLDILPTFLDGASDNLRIAYQTAATVTDVLPYIPCYCGCGESAGHQSNLNCFIADIEEDGSVVWDDHGTRCGVCIEIAVTTAAMKSSGIEVERIRQIIDETYKEGYAKPTQTKLPPAS